MIEPQKHRKASDIFSLIAQSASQKLGHPLSFITAFCLILLWAILGPVFKYSNTWQLVINTGTTIVTFLMVFLIQNTQNRDMAALHLKLGELIRVNTDARNTLLALEDMTEEELKSLKGSFEKISSEDADPDEIKTIGTAS
jgi:low affinity Fe/Cu permease